MPGTQTRTPKTKATSQTTGRGSMAAGKPKRGNSGIRPSADSAVDAQERQMLIARAAYFRAEKRGFAPGCELQDWIEAEAEVQRLIGSA